MSSYAGHKPKFVRRFADVGKERVRGARAFTEAVKAGRPSEVDVTGDGENVKSFPRVEGESYVMDEAEWAKFLRLEGDNETEKG
jgi:3-methyl-2-oxobutanoate hydroxymethyltransferase